jgi:hypothetical protein
MASCLIDTLRFYVEPESPDNGQTRKTPMGRTVSLVAHEA